MESRKNVYLFGSGMLFSNPQERKRKSEKEGGTNTLRENGFISWGATALKVGVI